MRHDGPQCGFPEYDGENINYKVLTDKKIPLVESPVSVTVLKFGDHILVDPSNEEEKGYDARLTVGVREDGKLCSMQKGGDGTLTLEDVEKMIDISILKSKMLRSKL